MRILALLILFISSSAFASIHNMAMIQNGVIQNIAIWDDVATWNPAGYTLVDITSQPQVAIGWTCTKCDGSDFVAPSGN